MGPGMLFLIQFVAAAILTCITAAYFDKQFDSAQAAKDAAE